MKKPIINMLLVIGAIYLIWPGKEKPDRDDDGFGGEAPSRAIESFKVWATTEENQKDALGGFFDTLELMGALPDRSALNRKVKVYYPKTGLSVVIDITDVGPWNIDDPYWNEYGAGIPRVEASPMSVTYSTDEPATNKAGIDLSVLTWVKLGVEPQLAMSELFSDYVIWSWYND